MAVTLDDIKALRTKTGAGMSDCKKALTEAEGDFEKAIEIIRKKGLAVAAKRSDREASEGCVLVKVDGNFGAMIALKCETDFVANNKDFVALTQSILDAAVAAKAKSLDEVKALPFQGKTVADIVLERTGIVGEKLELDGYNFIEGPEIASYNHQGKNFLCCLVAFNKEVADKEYVHEIALQVAAQNPIAVKPEEVPADIVAREKEIAADKAREEGKPENMIERIAEGRMKKFYDESCLLNQKYIVDEKKTVAEYLKALDKDLTVAGFRRFTLKSE
ncbi:MAG: elongation factor Ts [Bacteroidaceae bacterium]|jgi:elongation factor Ts|nr:elongation factor Ts [Bacteroidaceae bacterium]